MKIRYRPVAFSLASLFVCVAMDVSAQGAGAGADFNRADRAQIQESERLQRVDPPVREDPIGNALIGGAVTGTMKGAAAGAVSAVKGGAVGSAVQGARQGIEENRQENLNTGRGGATDPRYDPRSLAID